MSGRGGGRRRGGDGRRQPPPPVSGQQQPRAAPPTPPSVVTPSAPSPAASIADQMEQKLTLQQASSSSTAPQPQPQPQLAPSSTKALRNPARPGFGTIGRKVVVKANHFLVSVADDCDLNHYDVSISPEVLSKKVCREIMKQLVKSFRASHLGKRMLAYDGRKSCYTAGQLPFSSKVFVVKLVDEDRAVRREREFNVTIKFASKADLHHLESFLKGRQLDYPQETIQCLDIVLRENPSNSYEVVGRSFFHPLLGGKGELGNGLEYWKGFYQSLRPTQMGLSLNIDMSARAFYEPILVSDYVAKYLNRDLSRPLSDQDRIKVKKALRGVWVENRHQGHIKQHKILGVTTEPMQQLMFPLEESGESISVVQYFLQKYNIELEYPFLPALQGGSRTKPVYLPMELSKIVDGQRYSRKLNERQVTALLRATCQRPEDRKRSIEGMVNLNNYNGDALQVMPELTSTEARVLPPPRKMVNDGEVDFCGGNVMGGLNNLGFAKMSNSGPTTAILNEKFNGENFMKWRENIYIALLCEKIAFVLYEKCPQKPYFDAPIEQIVTYQKWVAANKRAMSYMLYGMNDDYKLVFEHAESAYAIMDTLQSMIYHDLWESDPVSNVDKEDPPLPSSVDKSAPAPSGAHQSIGQTSISSGKKKKAYPNMGEGLTGNCFRCKKKGHWKRECPMYLDGLSEKKKDTWFL